MGKAIFTPNADVIVETATMARVGKLCQIHVVVRSNVPVRVDSVIGKLSVTPVMTFIVDNVEIGSDGTVSATSDCKENIDITISATYITED